MLDKKKVVLGLSGGVDSTTAALLLKEKGLEVTGLYFDVFENNDEGRREAQKVAEELGIDFVYVNVHERFEDIVIDNFCNEYIKGRTPNPCIVCNPAVKFKTLLDYADKIGAYYIATGHYGQTVYSEEFKSWFIKRGNSKKDQTYMLYRLPQEIISRFLMPLEGYEKKEDVRALAEENGISNAKKKDSQEICFIAGDSTYIEFLNERGYTSEDGKYVDKSGNFLGNHKGVINYTIGQRKGLGVTFGKPAFVVSLNAETGDIVIGDNEDLFKDTVHISDCFFPMTGSSEFPEVLEGITVEAKIRYAAKPSEAVLQRKDNGCAVLRFKEKQRAATPGQSLVFYKDDMVLGGGYIDFSE